MSNELNEKIEITEEPTASFEEMGLSEPVLRAIHDMEFSQPTEIQARAIPAVMSGKDIIGRFAHRHRKDHGIWRAGC